MRTVHEFGTIEARRALAVGVIAAVVATAAVGVAGAQRAGNATAIGSCTTIDAPGRYVLTRDITGAATASDEACIEVTAGGVVLDGQGHLLAGSGSGNGVAVNGTTEAVTNVTVRRLHAANWSIGVFYLGADNGTIAGTVTNDTTEGVKLAAANRNRVVATTGYDNAIAVSVAGESQNNTLRNNIAVENKWGYHFERESPNNTVSNNVARNNSRWGYYSLQNAGTNTVRDLRLATATVSFTGRNVALRSERSPPALPRGTRGLGSFVEAMATAGSGSSLSLTMDYDTRAAGGSPVSVWRNDGQYWSGNGDSRANASAGTVSAANLTEFGVFAALANDGGSPGGSVTVTPDEPVSVQRTLTTVPGASTGKATNASTQTGAGVSTPAGSGTPAATGSGSASTVAETAGSSSNASGETTGAATGESGATTGTFGLDPARLLFVALGLVGLLALGLVVLQQRGRRGGGF